MAGVGNEHAQKLLNFNKNIIQEDLIYKEGEDYGREVEPHVTIKYGLTESYNPFQIEQIVKNIKPFPIYLGKMDIFENDKFDVIKFNIDGRELRKLNELFSRFPNEDQYPVYRPHMTLAYVKKGYGKKYKNRSVGKISRLMVEKIIYSDCGDKNIFKL